MNNNSYIVKLGEKLLENKSALLPETTELISSTISDLINNKLSQVIENRLSDRISNNEEMENKIKNLEKNFEILKKEYEKDSTMSAILANLCTKTDKVIAKVREKRNPKRWLDKCYKVANFFYKILPSSFRASENPAQENQNIEIQAPEIVESTQTRSNVEYLNQIAFIQHNLHKEIRECGGDGNCLIYSVMRQTGEYRNMGDKDFLQNAPKVVKQIRCDIADYMHKNWGIEYNDPNLISLCKSGEYLDFNGDVGKWLAVYYNRNIIVFPESNGNPGYVSAWTLNGEFLTNKYLTLHEFLDNAIIIYYYGNGTEGHYQAVM